MHTLRLTSTFGRIVAAEEVPETEFEPALRRFHDQVLQRPGVVVVVDGIQHTRDSFLQFVRAFNDRAARERRNAAMEAA
ncbi:MAG TPA: hypothetical protein VEA40_26635 [Ramlibacter sp.]|nr:hypothetical protein [Ramlibacter sp.]